MRYIYPLILVLCCAVYIPAQQLTPEQVANQRLGKAMDVIDKQDAQIKAQQQQIDDLLGLVTALKGENTALKTTNSLLLTQNQDLSKLKANKFSIFFGLVSWKRFK